MKHTLFALILIAMALPAFAADSPEFWNDGDPEVVLGAYFDATGRDSVFEGEIGDTLSVYLMMWNGSLRNEGGIRVLEYSIDIPDCFMLMKDELPKHSHLAMGTVTGGFAQAITDEHGDGLLINTLKLYKVSEVPFDSRIRVLPHPVSGFMQYGAGKGSPENIEMHRLQPADAILNPKLVRQGFKPVRSN
jgi:hypothetical protein